MSIACPRGEALALATRALLHSARAIGATPATQRRLVAVSFQVQGYEQHADRLHATR